MEFILPRSALPENKMLRRQILDQYFPSGLIPFEQVDENGWQITPFIPNDPAYFVDPCIEKSLQQWGEDLTVESLSTYRYVHKNAMLSFDDSWSAYYWSLVFSWARSKDFNMSHISLFHLDDHQDLASPHLVMSPSGFECIFSGRPVNFTDPSSIEHSIIQKSIGIDSFIAPLLNATESVNISHLRYAHTGNQQEYGLVFTEAEDNLLAKGKKRPSLEPQISDLESSHTKHSYSLSSSPHYLLEKLQGSPIIFLHIDCDAFNNRYNLDMHWNSKSSSIDLKMNSIKNHLDALFCQLSKLPGMIFMNVALSPGFFPSEYWIDVSQYIIRTAEEYGIVKEDEFSMYLNAHYPKETRYTIV